MEIEVKFYAMVREVTGKKVERITLPPKSSIRSLISLLIEKYGVKFERYIYNNDMQVRDYLSYLQNGININSLQGFDTILNDGDIISLLPPVGGG